MSSSDDLDRLRRYQAAFASAIDEVPADAPVVHCGDWTVRELVDHLADIYTWAARRAGGPKVRLEPGPALADHYREAAGVVSDALGALDPDQPCWTLLDDDAPADVPRIGTVRFWRRRQANETLVHLWDLRTAGGLDLDVPAAEWLDCLDEVLTVMAPRQVRLGRIAPREVQVLFAVPGEAVRALPSVVDAHAVTVHGSAEQLALLAWGRQDAADLAVEGDRDTLLAALAGIVP